MTIYDWPAVLPSTTPPMAPAREPWRPNLRAARLPEERRRRLPGFWGRKQRRRFISVVRAAVQQGLRT